MVMSPFYHLHLAGKIIQD